MIGSVHHIGIAVANLEAAIRTYTSMGFHASPPEVVASEGVRLAFVRGGGDPPLELLEPLSPDGVIARFLAKRGEGLHHLAFRTPNISVAMANLRTQGFRVLDEGPRQGHQGRLVAFVHPRSIHGVLVELVQD